MIAVIATRKGVVHQEVNDKIEGAGTEGGGKEGGDTLAGGGEDTAQGAAKDDTLAGGGEEQLSERELAMNAIEERNIAAINKEHVDQGAEPPVKAGAAAPPAGADTLAGGDDQLAVQTGDEDVLSADDLSRKRIRMKVDGQEIEVSGADLVRDSQKNKAADRRLDEATRLLKDARAVAGTPPASGPATPAPPVGGDGDGKGGKTPAQPAPDGGPEAEASGRQFLAALFEGDEDKAWEGLKKLVIGGGRSEAATLSEDQLIAKITPAVKQQLERESALDGFATRHRDLVLDTRLATLADGFLVEVQAEKPSDSFSKQLEEAATRTYKFVGRKGPTPENKGDSTTSRDKRLDAKKSADQAAGASARAAEPTEVVQTHSATIADMRKERGMEP